MVAKKKAPAKKKRGDDLTEREELFCMYCLTAENHSEAYRQAYPHTVKWKAKSVNERASALYNSVKVQSRVAQLKKERNERLSVDADYVLNRLVEIDQMDVLDILADDGGFKPIHDWPKVWRQYLSGIDVSEMWEGRGEDREIVGILKKIKWPDKTKNLELIGRHVEVQAFKDKKEVSGPNGGPIEHSISAKELQEASDKILGAL